jgi:surface polysaccharide O-acyltransferase-like enzyme
LRLFRDACGIAAIWNKSLAIVDTISENAYGIYFFHYTLAIWLQYALLRWSLPAIAKGLVVFICTLLLGLAQAS